MRSAERFCGLGFDEVQHDNLLSGGRHGSGVLVCQRLFLGQTEALRGWLKTQQTKALVGRILFECGDPKYISKVASVRRSISGVIDLGKTGKDLGLDDVRSSYPGKRTSGWIGC